MLARVTYALVGLALATLIGGFFTPDSNVLLFISIGLSVAAIILVLVGAARRAREAPGADLDEELFADVELDVDEEVDEALAAIGDDEDDDFEDLLADDEDEELYEDEEEEPRPVRRAAKTKAKTKPAPKPKAKPKAPAKRSTARASKVIVVGGRDRYHTPDCRFVKGKSGDDIEEITPATAKRRGFEPCSVCSPD